MSRTAEGLMPEVYENPNYNKPATSNREPEIFDIPEEPVFPIEIIAKKKSIRDYAKDYERDFGPIKKNKRPKPEY